MKILGFGAGGHSKVVIDILLAYPDYEVVGLVDENQDLWGTRVLGIPVLGGDSEADNLKHQGIRSAFIGVGSIGNASIRQLLYEKAIDHGFEVISALHRNAIISDSAKIGYGATVMAGALINADCSVGDNVIINTGAVLEHDCVLGNHVHVATGATLAGSVSVASKAHIGAGATVIQGITIGEGSLVGAGAVVVKDVPKGKIVMGVPAKVVR